jgi:hypothetical protein
VVLLHGLIELILRLVDATKVVVLFGREWVMKDNDLRQGASCKENDNGEAEYGCR